MIGIKTSPQTVDWATLDAAWALNQARDAIRRGATSVILGMPPDLGADGVDAVARDVATPLKEVTGS